MVLALAAVALAGGLVACGGDQAQAEPEPSAPSAELPDTPPDGLYAYDELIYLSPLSSYYPVNGTGELYLLHDGSLTILEEETGREQAHFSNSGWQSVRTELSGEEWEDLYRSPAGPADGARPDVSGYAQRQCFALGDRDLYLMDDEVWLGSSLWIFRLKPVQDALPASAADPEGTVDEGVDVPGAVLAGAEDYVRSQYGFWSTSPDWYYMGRYPAVYDGWRIDSIEQVCQYPAERFGLPVTVYHLGYRLHTLTPSLITLAGGMKLEDGGWLIPTPVTYLIAAEDENGLSYIGVMPANDYTPGAPSFDADLLELLAAHYGWQGPADCVITYEGGALPEAVEEQVQSLLRQSCLRLHRAQPTIMYADVTLDYEAKISGRNGTFQVWSFQMKSSPDGIEQRIHIPSYHLAYQVDASGEYTYRGVTRGDWTQENTVEDWLNSLL